MLISTKDIKIKKGKEEKNSAVFTFEPLPKGFGHTLGNTLRRVLLTSLQGGAITQIKVEGSVHQFDAIEGIKEDLVEVGLNLKQVRAKVHGDNPVVGKISATGPGKITAKDIDVSSDVEILNKGLHIATLADKKAKLEMELVFESGVGYSPVEERESSKVGVILLDALFSPVVSANYEVEETRKGGVIGLDKLNLSLETDGSIEPSDALAHAATILRDFFKRFALAEDPEVDEEEEELAVVPAATVDASSVAVDELPLPTRTINALKKAGVDTLSALAEKGDEELADIKNLGEKSIEEITKLLEKEGFR